MPLDASAGLGEIVMRVHRSLLFASLRVGAWAPLFLLPVAASALEGPAAAPLLVLPIAFAGWKADRAFALAMMLAASVSLLAGAPTSPVSVISQTIVFVLAAVIAPRLRAELDRGAALAQVDALTGVLSRAYFFELAEREVERARRTGRPLATLYVDLDGFKAINDTRGHAVGDKALALVGDALRATFRAVDLIGRVGGDEFVIVLPDTLPAEARAAMQRLRQRLEVESERTGLPIRASCGLSCSVVPLDSARELVAAADKNMYLEKRRRKSAHTAGSTTWDPVVMASPAVGGSVPARSQAGGSSSSNGGASGATSASPSVCPMPSFCIL